MDPLVRLALATQQLIARTAGTLLAIGFAAFVVYAETERLNDVVLYGALGLFLASLGYRVWQRRRRAVVEETTRLDLELFTHLVVLAYAVVLRTQGGLSGASFPVLYALVMLTASFARPAATVSTVAFAVLLESALSFFGIGVQPPAASWGNMLYQAQSAMSTEPWLALFPGLFIFVTVAAINTLGDSLADRRT